MKNLTIQLGKYTLKPLDYESYWLEKSDGEGTGIDKADVLNIVEAYFNSTLDDYFKFIM